MGYLPNELNVYDTYTYNISISMVRPSDSRDYELNGLRGSSIPIINNATDSRYNISNLEFITYTSYSQARNQIQGMFNMTVYEQNGVTLLNKIRESASALGIPSHLQAHYLVEITFNGREVDGAASQHRDAFRYALLFTKFTFTVDEMGTTYQIEGYEAASAGYQYINNVVQETTTIEASTVGEFVQEFERVYNLAQLNEVRMNPGLSEADQYRFEFVGATQEWLAWEFEELTDPLTSTFINVVEGNRLQVMLHNGSSLTDIMQTVLTLTREYKQIPVLGGGFYRSNGPEGESTSTLDSFPMFFKAIPEVTYGNWDPLRRDYAKQITFYIKEYATAELIPDATAYQSGISDLRVQTQRVQGLIGAGLMQKRYDYLYTGANTEVLGLDLKFDMIYYQTTALSSGQTGDPNVVQPQAGRDVAASIGRIQESQARLQTASDTLAGLQSDQLRLPGQLGQLQNQAAAIRGELSGPSGFGVPTGPFTTTLDSILGQASQLQTQIGALPGLIEGALGEFNSARSAYSQATEGLFDGVAYPLRFEADVINAADHGGTESNRAGGVFQFGAVRQTLENPADLLRIELYIRGDPYWLGIPKSINSTSGANAYDYTRGGAHFFLFARLPVADEDTAGLRQPRPDYQITAVYRVLNVINRFTDGKFEQYLDCHLDTATNAPIAIDALQSGQGGSPTTGGPGGPASTRYGGEFRGGVGGFGRSTFSADPAARQETPLAGPPGTFAGQPSSGPGSTPQPLGGDGAPFNPNNGSGPF